jgi:methionyl-tRNA synthetase
VHGTPIMLAAEKAGKTPEDFILEIEIGHRADFKAFGVDHDCYYTTHSPENRELAEFIYKKLRDAKPSHIATRAVRQFYDPVKQMFLPDRYIKGECPNCGTPDQYGDNCEHCGATYAPTDLKNPRSVMSGATPELRDSEHYFFKLGDFTGFLRKWMQGDVAHASVKAKLKEWLDADGGLRDWDISRDAPYFGFPIPDAPGKFFYVWLDAPVGYLAAFKKYCASDEGRKKGLSASSFDDFMQPDSAGKNGAAREMHHFLGKDIVNFHGLFWPAMLEGARLRTPTKLHVNGYLTVNGEKMSKSRGTFIQARTYLDAGLNPDYLRYYFATMLSAAPTDIDLDLKAFEERVNSHLVGKWVNIASRTAGFLHAHFDGAIVQLDPEYSEAFRKEVDAVIEVARLGYIGFSTSDGIRDREPLLPSGAGCDFNHAAAKIMFLADRANEIIARERPWNLAKQTDEASRNKLHQVCSLAINFFRTICILLTPIVPAACARAASFLDESFEDWKLNGFTLAATPSLGKVKPFESLMVRIDPKQIEAMIENSKESLQPTAVPAAPAKTATVELSKPAPAQTISIDDFAKLDLRVGTVLGCEFVDGSDKLLRFELDAGDLGKRQIFSGIRAAYQEPAKLIGRKVVFIANLAPRKMRFGVSEGMILSAGFSGDALFLLDVDAGATPGMPVK